MAKKKKYHKLSAIDFFCGAGGMTYGLSKAGIKVMAGIDINPDCKETYLLNNPGSQFIEKDIHYLEEEHLAKVTGIKKEKDYLVFSCCSPCQYWTNIFTNKKRSKNNRNLLKEFQRFIEWFYPGFIIIENVPGLFKGRDNVVLMKFLKFLDNLSYFFDHGIINANDYGVPQNRERYLLIGSRITSKIKLPRKYVNQRMTVRNFIGNQNGFPSISAGHVDPTEYLHTSSDLSDLNIERIKRTPKDGGTRSSWKNNPKLAVKAYRNKDHYFRNVYSRMFWDKPAPTITTRFNSYSNGRFGHPEENRALSYREGATLQTFPKKYIFKGKNMNSIATQIGNAVPPNLSQRIGKAIQRGWDDA